MSTKCLPCTSSTQELSLSCKHNSENACHPAFQDQPTDEGTKFRLRGGTVPGAFFAQNSCYQSPTPLICAPAQYPNWSMFPYGAYPPCSTPIIFLTLPETSAPPGAGTQQTSGACSPRPHDLGISPAVSSQRFTLPSAKSADFHPSGPLGKQLLPCSTPSGPPPASDDVSMHVKIVPPAAAGSIKNISRRPVSPDDDVSMDVEIIPPDQPGALENISRRSASPKKTTPRGACQTLQTSGHSYLQGSEIPSEFMETGILLKFGGENLKNDGLDIKPLADERKLMLNLFDTMNTRRQILFRELLSAKLIKASLDSDDDVINREGLERRYHQHKKDALEQLKKYLSEREQLFLLRSRMDHEQAKIFPCQLPENDVAMKVEVVPGQPECRQATQLEKSIIVPTMAQTLQDVESQKKCSPVQPVERSLPSGLGLIESGEKQQSIILPPVAQIQQNASCQAKSDRRQESIHLPPASKLPRRGSFNKHCFRPCLGGSAQPQERSLLTGSSQAESGGMQESIVLPPADQIQQSCQQAGNVSRRSASSRQQPGPSGRTEIKLPSFYERSWFLEDLKDDPSRCNRGEGTLSDEEKAAYDVLDKYLQRRKNILYHITEAKKLKERLDCGAEPENCNELLHNIDQHKRKALEHINQTMWLKEEHNSVCNRVIGELQPEIPPEEDVGISVKVVPEEAVHSLLQSDSSEPQGQNIVLPSAHHLQEGAATSQNMSRRSTSPRPQPSCRKRPASYISGSVFGEPPFSSTGMISPHEREGVKVLQQQEDSSFFQRSSFLNKLRDASYSKIPIREPETAEQKVLFDLHDNMVGRKKKILQNLLGARAIKDTLKNNPEVPNRQQLLQKYEQHKREALSDILKCREEKEECDNMANRIINALDTKPQQDFFLKVGIVPGEPKQDEFVSLQAGSSSCGSPPGQSSKNHQGQFVSASGRNRPGPSQQTAKNNQIKTVPNLSPFQRSILNAKNPNEKVVADNMLLEKDKEEKCNMQRTLDTYFKKRKNAVSKMMATL